MLVPVTIPQGGTAAGGVDLTSAATMQGIATGIGRCFIHKMRTIKNSGGHGEISVYCRNVVDDEWLVYRVTPTATTEFHTVNVPYLDLENQDKFWVVVGGAYNIAFLVDDQG